MNAIKEKVYEIERMFLSKNAFLSQNTAGRLVPVEECPLRTPFQRDRDRIIHCKAFRRLMHKMQVFVAPEGDHYRTRLTHTLEVTQIARTIARGMLLNEDLTEAAALAHDLGHTPFGHSGERSLNFLCSKGFRHNEQSLRVTDVLEKLNLTHEVRDGIINHTNGLAATKEGQIVKAADRIAYINHDIDDAVRAGILRGGDVPKDCIEILGASHSKRISAMVNAVIAHGSDGNIGMDEPYGKATEKLHEFMFEAVYKNRVAKSEDEKVENMLTFLFKHFTDKPDTLPAEYRANIGSDGVEVVVCDYIAGMTDRYALSLFEELFVPKAWQYK
ncbi:MAG: deoxyguanosinetriphosphate triphosphohydrolase [Eubacteriales bacterium]|nr:deoxyguanosinetriphosphate triphosphohydrolase [Eubacteriales bacterium]